MFDAKDQKKYQGGFDYRLPMASNWSFRQFGEVIGSQYPWGLLDEVVYKYYDGEKKWVTVSMMKSWLPCLLGIKRKIIFM